MIENTWDRMMSFGFDPAFDSQTYFKFNASAGGFWFDEQKDPDDAVRMGTAEDLIPREGYVDGGIILAATFNISKSDYVEMEASEWNKLSSWIDSMPNIWGNVVLKDEVGEPVLWQVYDKVPVITSMEA